MLEDLYRDILVILISDRLTWKILMIFCLPSFAECLLETLQWLLKIHLLMYVHDYYLAENDAWVILSTEYNILGICLFPLAKCIIWVISSHLRFIMKVLILNFSEDQSVVYSISPTSFNLISPLKTEIYHRTEKNWKHTHTNTDWNLYSPCIYNIGSSKNVHWRAQSLRCVRLPLSNWSLVNFPQICKCCEAHKQQYNTSKDLWFWGI